MKLKIRGKIILLFLVSILLIVSTLIVTVSIESRESVHNAVIKNADSTIDVSVLYIETELENYLSVLNEMANSPIFTKDKVDKDAAKEYLQHSAGVNNYDRIDYTDANGINSSGKDFSQREFSEEEKTTQTKTTEVTTEQTTTEQTTEEKTTEQKTEASTEATTEKQEESAKEVTITIKGGMSSYPVCQMLQEIGVIKDAMDFDNYLIKNGYASRISVGTHTLKIGMSYEEIAIAISDPR